MEDNIYNFINLIKDNKINNSDKDILANYIYDKIKYYILYLCNNKKNDADEALQFAIKKIFNNINKFDVNKGKFDHWLLTIAKNETLFFLFRKNRDLKLYDSIDEKYIPLENIDTLERENIIHKIYEATINEIYNIKDVNLKKIAIAKYIYHNKVREIAKTYKVNENTVKTRLRMIRKILKEGVIKNNPSMQESLKKIEFYV